MVNREAAERYGAFLRQQRHDRKLTQERLARRAHISVARITAFERGLAEPTASEYARLSSVVGEAMSLLASAGEDTGLYLRNRTSRVA